MSYKVGIGYDIHRLVEGKKLFIGGVRIPHRKGLLGHSDADVLLHAICDALLGAALNTDIGEIFPDDNPKYNNISSTKLLKNVMNMLKKEKLLIGNIDTIVIAQEPKLSRFKQSIRSKISQILNVPKENISIKAKTNEGLGDLGEKKAIAAYAIATVIRGADR